MSRRVVLLVVFAAVGSAGFACSDFREGVAAPSDGDDAGGSDGSSDGEGTGDGIGTTDAAPDGGPPSQSGDSPPDSECKDRWTSSTRSDPTCLTRRAVVVEQPILEASAVSVAVTGTMRIGIVYNSMLSSDQGELHIAHFNRPTAIGSDGGLSPAAPTITVIGGSQFDNIGVAARVAASAGPDLHILFQTLSDSEVNYTKLGTTGGPTPSETVRAGIASPAKIALAVLPNGDISTVFYDPPLTTLYSKLRSGGTWGDPVILKSDIDASGVPGLAQVAEVVDSTGALHVAFHSASVDNLSDPRYAQYTGAGWTTPKVLDNISLDGISGFSIALAIVDDQTRNAAFFYRPSGATVADLRLATWVSVNDMPSIAIVDQSIPSADVMNPRYRMAMASDAYGLLHIAVVRPQADGTGTLEYWRQSRRGGTVSWLRDVVDDDVLTTNSSQSLVDVAVDKDARVHIAYYRGTDAAVMYATRLDRP